MQITILEQKKNKLAFELDGADHTICNALKTELLNDESISVATYAIKHPLVGKPQFIVQTKTDSTPKKAMLDAIKRLKKQNEKFAADFEKAVK